MCILQGDVTGEKPEIHSVYQAWYIEQQSSLPSLLFLYLLVQIETWLLLMLLSLKLKMAWNQITVTRII